MTFSRTARKMFGRMHGELSRLVEEYFGNILEPLHKFTMTIDKCLNEVRERQLMAPLRCFEEEDEAEKGDGKYSMTTLEELRNQIIKFGEQLQSVREQQLSEKELEGLKQKVDKKLKSIKTWRKVSIITFASAFAAIIIGSVVAAAMRAPQRVAAALAAAAAIPVPLMGKWVNSLWKKYEDALKGEEELISAMIRGIAMNELASILDKLPEIIQNIDAIFGAVADHVALTDHEEAVKIGAGQIKRKPGNFMNIIEDLGNQVDRCTGKVTEARTVVLHKKNNY